MLTSNITETNRTLVSFQATFQPVDWLSHRLVFGRDRFTSKNVNQIFKDNPAILFTGLCGQIGCKDIELLEQPVTTLDFSGTASFQPSERPAVRNVLWIAVLPHGIDADYERR